jgi:hypothetical protein
MGWVASLGPAGGTARASRAVRLPLVDGKRVGMPCNAALLTPSPPGQHDDSQQDATSHEVSKTNCFSPVLFPHHIVHGGSPSLPLKCINATIDGHVMETR